MYIRFPRLFTLAIDKSISIKDVGKFGAHDWTWKIPFRRRCFDWEVNIEREFYELINNFITSIDEDGFLWLGDINEIYTIKGICYLVKE